MKKLILTLLTLLMVACGDSKKETIIKETNKYLGAPTSVEGNVYRYKNVTEDNVYKDYKDIKGFIDKTLKVLPVEKRHLEVSLSGEIHSFYKWETPNMEVSLWVSPEEQDRLVELVIKEK